MYQLFKATSVHRRFVAVASMAIVISLMGACTSTPLAPVGQVTAAQDAIVTAEQSGARQHAGAELDEAQQQLLQAERAIKAEHMLEAERFAEQSRVTAELASARTEAAKAVAINREMGRGAEALIDEMQRSGDQQ